MCGLSKNQPYCDRSHKRVADEEDGKTYEYDSEGAQPRSNNLTVPAVIFALAFPLFIAQV
jgi:CDGSH-type Zn-finger protein